MTDIVRSILSDKRRSWRRNAPLSASELDLFKQSVDVNLPTEYYQLLSFSNGGEGELALVPGWFILYDAEWAMHLWHDKHNRRFFPGLFFFGSNGGLELIAFDMRRPSPWLIVMVDPIAGIDSTEVIAPGFMRFLKAMGLPDDIEP